MIGLLKGELIDTWKNGSRLGITMNCSGVGYEVQILERDLGSIKFSKILTLWIHHLQREDGSNLVGFLEKSERNLFRKLISVSGVGPQLGVSLLDYSSTSQLIFAITQKDISLLKACPGVGAKTAERLAIELHNKLADLHIPTLNTDSNRSNLNSKKANNLFNEVRSALINLEYKEAEIELSLAAIEESYKSNFDENKTLEQLDFEKVLRETLIRINTETG